MLSCTVPVLAQHLKVQAFCYGLVRDACTNYDRY